MSVHLGSPAVAPTAVEAFTRPLATWDTRHPWRWGVVVSLGGLVLTAVGMGVSDARGLDGAPALLTQAAFVALSAVVGLLVMWRTRPSLSDYGFRRPVRLARSLWALPLVAVIVIVAATSDLRLVPATLAASTVLAVAVGFNEEIWFRGLLLAALRTLGNRRAIIAASVIFGALHLTNVFTGQPLAHLIVQFAFACLVGLVLAEVAVITGSLWVGIAWHVVYDAVALTVVDDFTTAGLVGLSLITVLLAGYAVWLWRAIPVDGPRVAVAG